MNRTASSRSSERGFTLIEIMIAAIVMVIALLAVAYGVGVGMTVVMASDEDAIARQKAREALEDVLTARDTASITWSQICNVGNGANCIFINGAEPMYTAGPDEIVNTADDGQAPFPPGTGCTVAKCVEAIDTPGPDGILGTADDIFIPLNGFSRQIQITQIQPQDPPLAQITVTIFYTTRQGLNRQVSVNAIISPYV